MQTEKLKITGMSCGGCTNKVTRALEAVAGVSDVVVSLATHDATVKYDEQIATPGQLKSAVEKAGYGVTSTSAAEVPQSKGCCCGSKVAADMIKPAISTKEGPVAPRMPERSTPARQA